MMPLVLVALLAQTAIAFPHPHTIELHAANAAAGELVITLPRDERLNLEVQLTAPATESDVEDFAIKAENQSADYWKDRPAPNLSVKVERLLPNGEREAARVRIVSSGRGKSLNVHTCSVMLDIVEAKETRAKLVREALERKAPGSVTDATIQYFEPLLVANPPGRYEFTIEYKPATGIYAQQPLGRRFIVEVKNGPHSLDRLQ